MNNFGKLIFPFIITAVFACQSPGDGEKSNEQADDSMAVPEKSLSEDDKMRINSLINSISPPLELTYIINDLELNFSPKILSDPKSVENYENSLDQAAAIGVYGSDLVYCLIYNRNDLAMQYLSAIRQLSVSLNLTEVIDFDKLEKLANDEAEPDELAANFTMQMENVHNHLSNSNRLDQSAMLAFGGWIESIYITSVTGQQVDEITEEVVELIYYQTTLSQTFLDIFTNFNDLRVMESNSGNLEELIAMYGEFETQLMKAEPEITHSEEMTTVIDLSTQELIYKPEQVEKLVVKIKSIRSGLIK